MGTGKQRYPQLTKNKHIIKFQLYIDIPSTIVYSVADKYFDIQTI
jgi:hypothetical protein